MTTVAPIALELEVITMSDFFMEKLGKVIEDIDERNDFLPAQFQNNVAASLTFERLVFSNAEKMSEDYTGNFWDFAKTHSGDGFFIYPSSEKSFCIHNQNTYQHSAVDGRIFGLMASLMVFSHASIAFHKTHPTISDMFGGHYHNLRNAFYDCVEILAYDKEGQSEATEEQRSDIKAMSAIVTSYLD